MLIKGKMITLWLNPNRSKTILTEGEGFSLALEWLQMNSWAKLIAISIRIECKVANQKMWTLFKSFNISLQIQSLVLSSLLPRIWARTKTENWIIRALSTPMKCTLLRTPLPDTDCLDIFLKIKLPSPLIRGALSWNN